MQYFNLHTHTDFCDGSSPPDDYIAEALRLGFHTLGFSSHSPLPFENPFSLQAGRFPEYLETFRLLREKFKGSIEILTSLEFDYVPGISDNFSQYSKDKALHYTLGGVHLVKSPDYPELWFIDGTRQERYDEGLNRCFGGNIKTAVSRYYHQLIEMVLTQKPDIVVHMDKVKMHNKGRFFSEKEAWYIELVDQALDAIAETGSIIEVNTRGLYKNRCDTFYPSAEILEKAHRMDIPVTVSSDAHAPQELNGWFDEACLLLRMIGFTEVACFNGNGRVMLPILE